MMKCLLSVVAAAFCVVPAVAEPSVVAEAPAVAEANAVAQASAAVAEAIAAVEVPAATEAPVAVEAPAAEAPAATEAPAAAEAPAATAETPAVAEPVAVSPYRKALESAVAKGHPRLFADAAAFDWLKAEAGTPNLRQTAAARVRERAEQLLGTKPLERTMIGRRLLHTSRKALYRISTLAMAYRLTGESKFLDRAVAELKAVCAFVDWNPAHFLDTGEMSLAVAIGYDWLYSDLSNVDRAEIRAGLAKNGLAAGVLGGWWTKSRNNWGQVCRAGMIAASLSLADDPQLLDACAKMLGESVEALPLSMEAMAPDGCYPEGTGYWHYGVSFNVFAIAMLESACGTDFGLSGLPGFMETAEFPNAVTGPTGLTIAYSDCGSSRGAMQPLWWFAKKLNRPDLITEREIAAWNAAPSGEGWLPPVELFWMDDRAGETVRRAKAPRVWAPNGVVPLAILRSGWGKNDAFAGIKGGSPQTNHGHMDGGNFVLDMGGVRWAWELPHEDYNRIEQMKDVSLWNMSQDSGRWSLLRLNTFGHNVPSIDGEQQAVDGFAKVLNAVEDPLPSAELDLTSLYPAAKKVVRWCTLGKDGRSFFVQDVFEGLKPGATVRWQFILKAKAEVEELGGRSALKLEEQGRSLVVLHQGTAATPWQVEPAEGPQPLNSPNPGFSRAYFTLTAGENGRASVEVAFTLDEPDVVIYGSSPAALTAAIEARRHGRKAVIVCPETRIGGLTTGGLGQTDIGNKSAFGGLALQFYKDVADWYKDPAHWKYENRSDYIPDGQCAGSFGEDSMWTFEPSAALTILERWEKVHQLDIRRGEFLDRGKGGVVKEDGRIVAIKTLSGKTYFGRMFVDATYEGDLMAAAGVSYVVGREANSVYGETISGIERGLSKNHQFNPGIDPYVVKGDPTSGLLPWIEPDVDDPDGTGDKRVQAYCFRMCLTDEPSNRIPFVKPEGYDPLNYELLLRNLESIDPKTFVEKAKQFWEFMPWINSRMPNRKTDTNNRTGFSTDFIGQNHAWPEASYAEREKMLKAHLDYQMGLMWTLANDPRVPEPIRSRVAQWGTCKDEFADGLGNGWQSQLYVREGRRMVGDTVATEHDVLRRRTAARPVAMAAYGMDSHHVRRYVGKDGFVHNEGNIEDWRAGGRPYPLDYGVIVPKKAECENLFVPVCVSASHMAFGSIRMEPVFFALGQVAGAAAALSIDAGCAVQDLPYEPLKKVLLDEGQVIGQLQATGGQ